MYICIRTIINQCQLGKMCISNLNNSKPASDATYVLPRIGGDFLCKRIH